MIGINILVDMLMMKSETLQYIAGMAIIALATENIDNQNRIVSGGGVQPLVRLLRSGKTSQKVCSNRKIDKSILCRATFEPLHGRSMLTKSRLANLGFSSTNRNLVCILDRPKPR